MQPFSAHHLMTLCTCTKFQENISKYLKFTKGHNFITNVGGVTVLVPCTSPDNALYLSQDSNGRVDARVVAIYKGHNSVTTVEGWLVVLGLAAL